MLRLGLLITFTTVALAASCGGTVGLEERPCPCSDGWTCCAYPSRTICLENADSCPPPPEESCEAPWTLAGSDCVLDMSVVSEDVCKDGANPLIQVDRLGILDACVSINPVTSMEESRPFNCSDRYTGPPVEGMVVKYGLPNPRMGRDTCLLHAAPLTKEPAP